MNIIHVTTKPYTELTVNGCGAPNALGRMASRNSDHVLALKGTRFRFGLGYSEPNTWYNTHLGKRVFTDKPVGYTFGLATCIAANPEMSTSAEIRRNKEANLEHDVAEGDVIVTDYQYAFKVRVVRREFLELDYLGQPHEVRGDVLAEQTPADFYSNKPSGSYLGD